MNTTQKGEAICQKPFCWEKWSWVPCAPNSPGYSRSSLTTQLFLLTPSLPLFKASCFWYWSPPQSQFRAQSTVPCPHSISKALTDVPSIAKQAPCSSPNTSLKTSEKQLKMSELMFSAFHMDTYALIPRQPLTMHLSVTHYLQILKGREETSLLNSLLSLF